MFRRLTAVSSVRRGVEAARARRCWPRRSPACAAGGLLARAKKHDVVDAAIVLLSNDGGRIVTSDPGDLEPLAMAAGRHVDLVRA
jgi:hypothetical protein